MGRPLIPVSSSNLEAVGWSKGTLTVRFTSGATYKYESVPRGVYQQLLRAESHGKFLNTHVKGHYTYSRVDTDE